MVDAGLMERPEEATRISSTVFKACGRCFTFSLLEREMSLTKYYIVEN